MLLQPQEAISGTGKVAVALRTVGFVADAVAILIVARVVGAYQGLKLQPRGLESFARPERFQEVASLNLVDSGFVLVMNYHY